MKLSITFNGFCSGGNHVHITLTARQENDALIGTYPATLTADELFESEVEDFFKVLPVLIRGRLRELGHTRLTPVAQIRVALESREFRV